MAKVPVAGVEIHCKFVIKNNPYQMDLSIG